MKFGVVYRHLNSFPSGCSGSFSVYICPSASTAITVFSPPFSSIVSSQVVPAGLKSFLKQRTGFQLALPKPPQIALPISLN